MFSHKIYTYLDLPFSHNRNLQIAWAIFQLIESTPIHVLAAHQQHIL